MTISKPTCIHCSTLIIGRTDKKYCSIKCKNAAHKAARKNNKSVTKHIDRILHSNYQILKTMIDNNITQKKVPRLDLELKNFNFNYITGYYINKHGKVYHYVYDYAWMEFSTQEIMIVKKK